MCIIESSLFVAVKCHEPSSPHKGFVTVGSYKFGAVAWFSCLDGHQLVGFPRRTCMSNGIWSGVQPFCTSMSKCTIMNDFYSKNYTIQH